MKKAVLALLLVFAVLLSLSCEPPAPPVSEPVHPPAIPTPEPGSNPPVPTPPSPETPKPSPTLNLEDYSGEFFSIKKPAGWDIVTGGACSTFAFYTRDPEHPVNQIFYFNEVGPVYLAEEQKTVDMEYMDRGGFPVEWLEMPVVNPLTPGNFLTSFHLIAQTNIARSFLQDIPELKDIEIISNSPEESPVTGGQTGIIRALYRRDGELGEGIFYVTVAPLLPLSGMPGGGIGYGFCFTGITSLKSDFRYLQATLTQSLESLTISQSYIDDCIRFQEIQYQGILKAGKTLSETSDIIMESWENRNKVDDIISEKRSDAILGNTRVYNPDNENVYDVPLGFYEEYDLNRGQYNMNNLQLLPDEDWDLWTAPTTPGDAIN
jgi:hypothetical protein